tara:strand:+ start:86 stop:340 length:255 start_codon:yes stop_codon:yes gene_type:complete
MWKLQDEAALFAIIVENYNGKEMIYLITSSHENNLTELPSTRDYLHDCHQLLICTEVGTIAIDRPNQEGNRAFFAYIQGRTDLV